MKWFKHDSDAHRDAKLKRVQIKYGMEGYGLYWYCIELIASAVDQHNITFELEHDAEIIAHDTGIHYERVQEMMRYMVDLGLFEDTSGVITCIKLAKRIDQSMTSNVEMRKTIKQIRESHDDAVTESGEGHDGVMTASGVNHDESVTGADQIRLEENRKERGRFAPPSLDEVRQYCQERGNTVDPETFVDHYQAKNWLIGKAKMKDWKAAVRTWEHRERGGKKTERYGEGGI